MKLILHIVTKDLKRLRGWLLAWVAALVVPILLTWRLSADAAQATDLRSLSEWLPWCYVAQAIVGYLIVLVVVGEDGVIGTRSFWLTRPISGGRLLLAKVLATVTAVGGLAAIVGVPWWLYCGFGFVEVARAAGEYVLLALILMGPAMLMAALTDSLGRAILWSCALLAVLGMTLVPLAAGLGVGQGPVFVSRAILAIGVWLAGATAIVVHVYFTRRRGWVTAALGAAIMVGWAVCWTWSRPLFAERAPQEQNAARGAGIQVTFHEAWTTPLLNNRSDLRMDHVRVSFSATRPEAGLRLQGVGAEQTWRWQGVDFKRQDVLGTLEPPLLPGFKYPARDAETEAYFAAQRAPNSPARTKQWPTMPRPAEGVWLQSYALVPASWSARMAAEPSTYEARLWLSLRRPIVLNELPLQANRSRAGRGQRMMITGVEPGAEMTTIGVTDFEANFWTRELGREFARRRWFQDVYLPTYVVLNQERKESRPLSGSQRRSLVVHGVAVRAMTLTLMMGRVRRGDAWVEPDAWLERATLAYVGMETEALFARDVRREGFAAKRIGDQ